MTAEGVRAPRRGPELRAAPRPAVRFFSFGRTVALLLVAGVAVMAVRYLFVQSFVIPSESMRPLLQPGDRVLVSRWDYRVGAVRRGDVIVFDGEGVFDAPSRPPRTPLAGLGQQVAAVLGAPIGEYDYVKRVVGLPGERVACCDASGRVTIDGRPLDEPYLRGVSSASSVPFEIRVPAGRLWVMGDNRDDSGDSRAHLTDPGGGTVPLDHVVGRVMSVWWPWERATGLGRPDA